MDIASSQALGAAIRTARAAHGLTQSDLALAAGTSVPFIVDLERGKATVQLGKVLDVLAALGARVQLVGDLGEEAPS